MTGERANGLLTGMLAWLLVSAPFGFAGAAPLALLQLQYCALAVLLLLVWRPWPALALGQRQLLWALAAFVAFLAGNLLPVPAALWQLLPGRDLYWPGLQAAGLADAGGWRLSLTPLYSERVLWTLLPALAMFLGVWRLPRQRLRVLVHLAIAVAAIQAILGLLQYGAGPGSGFYLGNDWTAAAAVGTFGNRNHLAGFLCMFLPMVIGLAIATLGRGDRPGDWGQRAAFYSSLQGNQALLYTVVAVLLLLGLVFTRSRMGIAMGGIGILLAGLLFSRHIGGGNVFGTVGTIVGIGLALALAVGLAPVVQRFGLDSALGDMRWQLYLSSLEGAWRFFPLGAGAGSYPELYPSFQPLTLAGFVNHAHNDYLEWLFESGAPGLFWVGLALALYLRQWPVLLRDARWSRFRFVQIGAGIGIAGMLLHGLLDFNQQIPANMLYLAFLAGLFGREPDRWVRRRARGAARRLGNAAAAAGDRQDLVESAGQSQNPFA